MAHVDGESNPKGEWQPPEQSKVMFGGYATHWVGGSAARAANCMRCCCGCTSCPGSPTWRWIASRPPIMCACGAPICCVRVVRNQPRQSPTACCARSCQHPRNALSTSGHREERQQPFRLQTRRNDLEKWRCLRTQSLPRLINSIRCSSLSCSRPLRRFDSSWSSQLRPTARFHIAS